MESLLLEIAVVIVVLGALGVLASRLQPPPRLDPEERRQLASSLHKVLVADDSITIRKVLALTFSDVCEVVEADNGDDALLTLETDPRVDLVVADAHMGTTSGFEVARFAKRQQPSRPVVVLYGAFESFDDTAFRTSGADAKLKKPFHAEELLVCVAKLLPAAPG